MADVVGRVPSVPPRRAGPVTGGLDGPELPDQPDLSDLPDVPVGLVALDVAADQAGTAAAPGARRPPGARGPGPRSRPRLRRSRARDGWRVPVTRYVVVSLVVLLVVGVLTDAVMSSLARQRALDAAVGRTDRFAETVVLPLLPDVADGSAVAAGPAAARSPVPSPALDAVVDSRVADGSLRSVTVWSADGTLVYARGRGSRDDVVSDDTDALPGGPVLRLQDADDASVDVDGLSSLPGRGLARLAPGDHAHVVVLAGEEGERDPLLVEVVAPAPELLDVADSLRLPMVAAALLALVVLGFAQLPLAVSLARRVSVAERSRRVLLAQAVASADLERRRLARQLHDDVIQDLAGLGYGLESLQRHGPQEHRAELEAARALVTDDVAKLRGILTDLYPSDLDGGRLTERLEALAAPLRDEGVDVVVRVGAVDHLDRTRTRLVHRVARECLANAHKHAHARTVTVSLRDGGSGTVLRVEDDGRGFDVTGAREEGHFGLTIVRDLVTEIGGSLDVRSRPGRGTTVTLLLPPA
ncbi:sensor histidine kinase [Aquipuribacter nitratireducens]|uniref:Oxygen sensor histidine kinase NreB n=1 Tax=Aquipuribacter nitratireducens TaxID=650104 RepID=A0ABW0GL90_9MICO